MNEARHKTLRLLSKAELKLSDAHRKCCIYVQRKIHAFFILPYFFKRVLLEGSTFFTTANYTDNHLGVLN